MENSLRCLSDLPNNDAQLASKVLGDDESINNVFPNAVEDANSKDYMLQTLSLCTREEAEPFTLGQYLVKSKEMDRVIKGDEIHIITNELMNYDFTPLCTLTISINTIKGVHYYYYGDARQKIIFDNFKERLKTFYKKSFKARSEIAAWIRSRKSKNFGFDRFITEYSRSISSVFYFLMGSSGESAEKVNDIIEDFKKRYHGNFESFLIQKSVIADLSNWIAGGDVGEKDLHRVYKCIDLIKLLSDSIGAFREKSQSIREFCSKAECLYNMKQFTQWQSTSYKYANESEDNPTLDRIEELLEYFATVGPENEIIIPGPLRQWLMPDEGEIQCGELPIDDSDINEYLNRIHFCVLRDGDPYTLCYSFSFFICAEGPDACWYITYNSVKDTPCAIKPDVYLLMIDIKRSNILYPRIKNVFRVLIERNPTIEKELEQSKSRLMDYLK